MAPVIRSHLSPNLRSLSDLPEDCLYFLTPFLKPEEMLSLGRVSKIFYAVSKDSQYWGRWGEEAGLIEGDEFIGREESIYAECTSKVQRLYALFARAGKALKKTYFPLPTRRRFSAIHAHTRSFFQAFFRNKLVLSQSGRAHRDRVPLVEVLRGFGDEYYRLFLRSISSQHFVLHTAIREGSSDLVQDLLEEGAKVTDFALKEAVVSGLQFGDLSTECLEILLDEKIPDVWFLSSLRTYLFSMELRRGDRVSLAVEENFRLACERGGFALDEIQMSEWIESKEMFDLQFTRLFRNKCLQHESLNRKVLRSMLLACDFRAEVEKVRNLFTKTVSERTVDVLIQGLNDRAYPYGSIFRLGYPYAEPMPRNLPPVKIETVSKIAEINSLLDPDLKEDRRMNLAISTRDIRVVELNLDLGAKLTLNHLEQSICTGDLKIVRAVFQEYLRLHPNAVQERNSSELPNWLSAAINTEKIDIVRYLLDLGCKPYNSSSWARFKSMSRSVRWQTLNCLLRVRDKEMLKLVSERVLLKPINNSFSPYVGSDGLAVSSYNEAILWGDREAIDIVESLGGKSDRNTPRILRGAPRRR